MKSRKFSFNWQSFLLGAVLCAVLVVFIGSKIADPQSGSMQRNMQRQVNLMDVWEKTSALDARVIAMDERLVSMDGKLNHLQSSIDETYKEILRLRKALGK
jgi:septal ring factor EnvC (AmiA/AmiB activator)